MSDSDKKIIVLAVIAAILAFIALLTVFYSVATYTAVLTGRVTAVAGANLTISSDAAINLSTVDIDWGEGRVDAEATFATLNTHGLVNLGNWSTVSDGLYLENTGNVNVSLVFASADTDAATFMGGTNPVYAWNFTNNETGACNNDSLTFELLHDVNTSLTVCTAFDSIEGADTIAIHFNITVPQDAAPATKSDLITITATAV
tara:strand:+ start:32 stop:640 length:609 start_codon:yes stop_codon:yes gene_type:complete